MDNANRLRQLAGLPTKKTASTPSVISEAAKSPKALTLEIVTTIAEKCKVDFTDADGKAAKKAMVQCYNKGFEDGSSMKESITFTDANSNAIVLTERYEGSHEFDEDVSETDKFLKNAKKILTSANWKKHMFDTDHNYGTNCVTKSHDLLGTLEKTIEELDAFYEYVTDEAQ